MEEEKESIGMQYIIYQARLIGPTHLLGLVHLQMPSPQDLGGPGARSKHNPCRTKLMGARRELGEPWIGSALTQRLNGLLIRALMEPVPASDAST